MVASVPQDAAGGAPRTLGALGRYVLYQELASGGIGSVCLARMRAPVGFSRMMAVKRLHPHHAKDPHFVTMFLDEARMAARVRHPNVVPVLDVVSDEDELFLVMEYVAGESLSKLLTTSRERGSRVEPAIAVAIMSGVLEGLHAAHLATNERGVPLNIVHRDVSPQNVLVGVDGVARVVDFGIAKASGRLQESTQTGQIKGKLLYMPPEQFINTKTVDKRSDVWSASVLLWEMLAGRRLFEEASDALRFQSASGAIERPSELGAPDVLDEVVLKGLARGMDERFQTAREMLVAMERAVAAAPARRVGQWVEKLAREALRKRAAYVEQIETDAARASAHLALTPGKSGPGEPAPATPAPATPAPATPAPALAATALATDDTSLAAGDVGLPVVTAADPKRRRALGLWLALAVLGGGVATASVVHPAIRGRLLAMRAGRHGADDAPGGPLALPSALPRASAGADAGDAPASGAAPLDPHAQPSATPPAADVAPASASASASAPASAPAAASTTKRARTQRAPAVRVAASQAPAPSVPAAATRPTTPGDPLELKSRE